MFSRELGLDSILLSSDVLPTRFIIALYLFVMDEKMQFLTIVKLEVALTRFGTLHVALLSKVCSEVGYRFFVGL